MNTEDKKYKGLKAICDVIFTIIATGTVFWSKDFNIMAATVLFTQNIMACYNSISESDDKDLFKINIFTICIDAFMLFFVVGIINTDSEVLKVIVRYGSLVCIARAISIVGVYMKSKK